jgi:hypothetical protein
MTSWKKGIASSTQHWLRMCIGICAVSSVTWGQTNVTVQNTILGKTYKYSGTNCNTIQSEDIAYTSTLGSYLTEVPFDVVRVRGGIIRTATTPFDGFTIDQVKANPNVLNWTTVGNWYAKNFTTWMSALAGTGTIVCPMLIWNRNLESGASSPTGCSEEATFRTGTQGQQDEAVFWIAAFGMAYWANVVNHYGLTHMDVSNEPDNCNGNGVDQVRVSTHNRMIQLAKDALKYVNQTSGLVNPTLPAIMVGPSVMTETDGWVSAALSDAATRDALDIVSWHSYWEEHLYDQITSCANDAYSRGASNKKQWLNEWGAFWYSDGYSNNRLVQEMAPIMPILGRYKIECQMVWNLYGAFGGNADMNLVTKSGQKSRFYWVTKLLNRALLGEKDLLATNLPNTQGYQKADKFFAWGSQDAANLYVIIMNHKTTADQTTVNVSAFPSTAGKSVSIYYVSGTSPYTETALAGTTVSNGTFTISAQANTHYVAIITGAGSGQSRAQPTTWMDRGAERRVAYIPSCGVVHVYAPTLGAVSVVDLHGKIITRISSENATGNAGIWKPKSAGIFAVKAENGKGGASSIIIR